MLRNSYNTFFNAKVKKFLKDNPSSGAMPGNVSPHENPEELKPEKERDATSVDLNMDLPSLNGKPKVDATDFLKAAKQRQKGNVPSTDVKGLDSSDTPKPIESTTETAENRLSAEVALPQVDIKAPDEMSGGTELPVVDVVAKSPDISEVDPSGLMPTAPDHNICVGVDMAEPNANVKTDTDISASPPVVLRGKDHVQSTLDVSLPVPHAGSPETTVKLTDDMQVPSSTIEIDVLPSDTNPPEVEFTPPNTDIHIPSKTKTKSSKRKSRSRVRAPELDLDSPSGYEYSSTGIPDLNLDVPSAYKYVPDASPDLNLDVPSAYNYVPNGLPDLNVDMPSAYEYTSRKLAQEKPTLIIASPKTKRRIKAPDLKVSIGDLSIPQAEIGLNVPDLEADLKVPDIGTLPKASALEPGGGVKIGSLNTKTPKVTGSIDMPNPSGHLPKIGFKGPETDLNIPDVDIDSPSGKFKMPRFKIPKFSFSGLKSPNVALEENLTAPDLKMPSPKIAAKTRGPTFDSNIPTTDWKGLKAIKTPKLEGPDCEINPPGLDVAVPDIDMHFAKPDLNGPDIDSPNINVDMPSAPSGKLKMPKFGLSGTLPKAPEADLKMPSMNVSGPKIKGDFSVPDTDMRLGKPDLKGPKLDLNSHDANINAPSGTLKMPKLKMPKFSLPGLKGPDVGIDRDCDISGDLNLSPPTIGGLDAPAVGGGITIPDMDLSIPRVKGAQNPNASNGNFTEPNLKLSPKVNGKMPEGQVQVSGTLKEPRLPDLDIDATLGKYKSHKKLRNDALDLDADVKFSNKVRPSRKTKGRASYPVSKENVITSALDTKVSLPEFPQPRDRVMTLPESSIHVSKTDMAGFAKGQKPGDGDIQKKKRPKSMEFLDSVGVDIEERSKTKRELYNGKLNSLRSLDVSTSNVDLDVPEETLKGSRFNLLNLI